MGGNVEIKGQQPESLALPTVGREVAKGYIRGLMKGIDATAVWLGYKEFWHTDVLDPVFFAAGSTSHIFDPQINDEDLIWFKGYFGDIDLQVDKDKKDALLSTLQHLEDTQLAAGEFQLIGWKMTVDTVVTLWAHTITCAKYQVDFELVEFDGWHPTEWSRWSRSSSWSDVKEHIKGFAHKYIFRAITAAYLQDATLQMATKQKQVKISPVVFSPSGARVKYREISPGLWKEIPITESKLIKDKRMMFRLIFGREPVDDDLKLINSFVGTVYVIKKYFGDADRQKIVDGMYHLLWGKGAQKLSREVTTDALTKIQVYEYLTKTLLGAPDESVIERSQEYYRDFYK